MFSKDEKKYDLNQFLVATSICFMHLYIFIYFLFMYFHKTCFPNGYLSVFSIRKSLQVLQKAHIKIVACAIYTYLFSAAK